MPDKRDIHQAKSHRNSKSGNKQQTSRSSRNTSAAPTTGTPFSDQQTPGIAPDLSGKRNKSRR